MRFYFLQGIFIFCLVFSSVAQEGKLETAQERLNQSASNDSSKSGSKRNSSSNEEPSVFGTLFGEIFLCAFYYAAYGLFIEINPESSMHDAEISTYPYKEHQYGNFIYTDSTNYAIARYDISNRFLIESKHLYGTHLNANLRFLQRMGFEVAYVHLLEKLPNKTVSFTMFSAMLNYYRVRTQKFDFSYGVGFTHVGKGVHKTGFSYGFSAEWFLKKPMSISASYKKTFINQERIENITTSLKYHVKNYNFSTGYTYFNLAGMSIQAFSLGIGISL